MANRQTRFRSSFLGGKRESTISASPKQTAKPKLGKDFVQHWDQMDKQMTAQTKQLEEVRELVNKGMVSEKVYQNLVKEVKEKELGLTKKDRPQEEFEEKPVLQGFLYHRVRNSFGNFKWRRYYCTLYRSRLEWKRKISSKELSGTIQLTTQFDLAELLPQGKPQTDANDNKYKMMNSFELTCVDQAWQFAAESAALKKYWFHTLGLSLRRIKERAKLSNEPVLMTTKPALQHSKETAKSVREQNYKSSMMNQSRPSMSQMQNRPSATDTFFHRKSADFIDVMDDESKVERRSERASSAKNSRQVYRVQYVPKNALMKNPQMLEDDEMFSHKEDDLPLLEVGEPIVIEPKGKSNRNVRRTQISEAQMSEQNDMISPRGSKIRNTQSSKQNTLKVQKLKEVEQKEIVEETMESKLEAIRKELDAEEDKVLHASKAMDVVTLQEANLKRDYENAKKTNDDEKILKAKEAWKRAKEFAILQEEILAEASLKKENLKEKLQQQEHELAKNRIMQEIMHDVKSKKMSAKQAATEILQRSLNEEEVLKSRTDSAQRKLKESRLKEMELMQDEEVAVKLRRQAVTKSIELKASELVQVAKRRREEAQFEREEREREWSSLVEESVQARLRIFQLQRTIEEHGKKRSEFSLKTDGKKTARSNQSTLKHVNSKRALADFMVANAEKYPSEVKKETKTKNKLNAFLSTNDNQRSSKKLMRQKSTKEEAADEYDDFTESYYSDEAYPRLDDFEFTERESFQKELQNHDYFGDKTKHIPEDAKVQLTEAFKDQEVTTLLETLEELLEKSSDDFITYGSLFEVYKTISDNLAATLFRAKNDGKVNYEGDYLLEGDDKDVEIKLI